MEETNNKNTPEIESTTETNNEITPEIESLKETNNEISPKKESTKETNNEITPEIESVKETNNEISPEESTKETNNEINPEIESTKETNNEITPEIESAKETNNEISPEIESLKETNNEIAPEIESAKETNNEISPEIESLKETNNEITTEIESAKETNNETTPEKSTRKSKNEISPPNNEIPPKKENVPRIIKLPGFIDTHVHIPFMESFDTGTCAALAGGITLICAMPDTSPPIIDEESFNLFQIYSRETARCDYAIYLAASEISCPYYCNFASETAGLIMYLNGSWIPNLQANLSNMNNGCCRLVMPNMSGWKYHLENWPKRAPGPIVCQAEKCTIGAIILYAYIVNRPIHICHVSKKEEIMIIRFAKDRGLNVTCEVCPHHLFLTTNDIERIGENKVTVIPSLGSPEDQKALWDSLNYIDVFATDHTGYTIEEKESAAPVYGLPGLETILPLLLTAVHEGRLTIDDIIQKFYKNPQKIFNLPEQPNTYIEVDMNEEWVIPDQMKFSRAKWTPYAGMKVKGKLNRVVLRGEEVFINGEILIPAGFGKDVRHKCYLQWKRCME